MNLERDRIFDFIDEYMALKLERHHIKITKSKDQAFGIMMTFGESFQALKDEKYYINGVLKRHLDKAKIEYEVLK